MLTVNLICVGKLKESYLREACAEYSKRLAAFCKLNIYEIEEERLPDNPSEAQIQSGIEAEGKRILGKVSTASKIIALCIEGKHLTSEELAKDIHVTTVAGTSNISMIIGGSFGLASNIKQSAQLMLSMSKMTFPHQLARVMILEQLYRAFMIDKGGKYHK